MKLHTRTEYTNFSSSVCSVHGHGGLCLNVFCNFPFIQLKSQKNTHEGDLFVRKAWN